MRSRCVVKELLKKGADATELDSCGRSIVEVGVEKKKLGVVKALLAAGASPDGAPLDGRTPLARARGLEKIEDALRAAGGSGLTDDQVSNRRGLRTLDLRFSSVSDAGLAHLPVMADLRDLSLWNTPVTDVGLAQVAQLSGLQKLSLSGTKVTDAGLARLSGLTRLRELDLTQTTVTDAGLSHLSKLTQLRRLQLGQTQVTDAGVAKLQAMLPHVRVRR